MGYNSRPGGYHITDETLVDDRMYFETIADRDSLEDIRISNGLFTFVYETQMAYIAQKDALDNVTWKALSAYKYFLEVELTAGVAYEIFQVTHLMPTLPIVEIYSRSVVDGFMVTQPIECFYGFDDNNDFHILSRENISVIIKMISNG
jgi:hypothetical protein